MITGLSANVKERTGFQLQSLNLSLQPLDAAVQPVPEVGNFCVVGGLDGRFRSAFRAHQVPEPVVVKGGGPQGGVPLVDEIHDLAFVIRNDLHLGFEQGYELRIVKHGREPDLGPVAVADGKTEKAIVTALSVVIDLIAEGQVVVPQRPHVEFAVGRDVHIDTDEEGGIRVLGQFAVQVPVHHALQVQVGGILCDITIAQIRFTLVDEILYIPEILVAFDNIRIFDDEVQFGKLALEEDVPVALFGPHIDFDNVAVRNPVLIDLDVFAQVIVAQELPVQYEFDQLALLFPAEVAVFLGQVKGKVSPDHGLVVVGRQQDPTLVFGHAEEGCLFPELQGVRFLGILPGGVSPAADFQCLIGQQRGAGRVGEGERSFNPGFLIQDGLLVHGVDCEDRESGEASGCDCQRYGVTLALLVGVGDSVGNRAGEVVPGTTADLRNAVYRDLTTLGDGEGRFEGTQVHRIGEDLFQGGSLCNREVDVFHQDRVVSFLKGEGQEGRCRSLGLVVLFAGGEHQQCREQEDYEIFHNISRILFD